MRCGHHDKVWESAVNPCEASDRAVARDFLRLFDEQRAAGIPPHRVSIHFAGTGFGTLRRDMEEGAGGGQMSSSLHA